ncbi:MAG: PLP-dependent aspartate aminotransferase family protein [Acidobacteriota bacterium]
MKKNKKENTQTLCIHGGGEPDPVYGAVMPPIYQTSTFTFESAEQGGRRFAGQEKGYIYTRLGNPTINALENSVAALENGKYAMATSTGMSAVSTIFFALCSSGDHIVASSALYGATRVLLENELKRFGITADFVDTSDKKQIEKAFKKNTKILYIETPTNPTLKISDIKWCADYAHKNGALLVVDNTFLSPVLQKPLLFGADIVLHSVTKFLNGHSDVVGGIIILNNDELKEKIGKTLKHLGGTMDPHQAYLVFRGIKTLALRILTAQENARKIARFLKKHKAVKKVIYPEFEKDAEIKKVIKKQMEGYGALISFELKGGFEAGKKLLNSVKIMTLAVSLGGVESLIQHPASMTHSGVKKEERIKAGITDGLVRLSVGCESAEDLINDLKSALDKIK